MTTASTTLRKLSYKSLMNFGKYPNMTPKQIIDIYGLQGKHYLVWCYYNLSNISFLDSILDDLLVDVKERILKPSKIDKDFVITNIFYNKPKPNRGNSKEMNAMKYGGKERSRLNKGKLQTRNHGH
jgi:hypothetical protein